MTREELLSQSIDILDLNMRAFNVLMNNGITTVQQLVQTKGTTLLRLRGMGQRTLAEIEGALREVELHEVQLPRTGTCRTCRWWTELILPGSGDCCHGMKRWVVCQPPDDEESHTAFLQTAADFGCVLWEEYEKGTES